MARNKGYDARRRLLAESLHLVLEAFLGSEEEHPVVAVLDLRDERARRMAGMLGEEDAGRWAEESVRAGAGAVMVTLLGRGAAERIESRAAGRLTRPLLAGEGFVVVVAANGVMVQDAVVVGVPTRVRC